MTSITSQYQQLNEKYLVLSVREKVLVLLSGFVFIAFCGFFYVLEPYWLDNEQLEKRIADLNTQEASLLQQKQVYQAHLQVDPNLALNRQKAEVEKLMVKMDAQLDDSVVNLVSPLVMPEVLQGILLQMKGVNIVSFKANEPSPLLINQPDKEKEKGDEGASQTGSLNTDNKINLYRHSLSLEVSGTYSELYSFLANVEALPWQFRWHNFHLHDIDYPNAHLSVDIYTLSLEKGFLNL